MKHHAIIPIFIPHQGCPNGCIFCNQRKITAKAQPVTVEMARETIETWLATLRGRRGMETIEIAFYGGSFTGIPKDEQVRYLSVAKEYKDRGLIQKLHLSTRPDYINEETLARLRRMSVDIIELGVQSFDERVLQLAKRGHDAAVVRRSAQLIREYGFTLGIQLMIGLPGDSLQSCLYSAEETVRLQPQLARLYPTAVLHQTELYDMWRAGSYEAPAQEELVRRTAAMYRILTRAGIQIIRVGLKSSELIGGEETAPGTYHPAFRQLVCGRIAREDLEAQLTAHPMEGKVSFYANGSSMSDMIGWRGENRRYFQTAYPQLSLRFQRDDSLADGIYVCRKKE